MEWVRLGDITEILDNRRVPLNNEERSKISNLKLYPYCGANGIIDYIDEFIFDEDEEIICVAEDGGAWGYLQKCSYIMKEKCWVNNHAHVLKAKSNFNSKFLNYYLNYKDLSNHITGTTRGKLTQKEVKNILIPNFKLEKQNIIVNFLSRIETLIRNRKEQIQAYDDLIESLFFEMFGDFKTIDNNKKIKLSEIATVRSSSRVFKKDLLNKGIDFYRGQEISNLSNNEFEKSQYFISEELYEKMKEKSGVPKIGDLLLPSIASDGQIWVVDTNKKFYFKDGRVLWISIDDSSKINSVYLKLILRDMLKRDFNNIASGTTFKELKIFLLKDLEVTYPTIELQNKFAEYVIKIEEEKKKLNSSLKELENLFEALMQDAFSGNLFKD